METALRIVILAVIVIVTAVLIVASFSLVGSGQSLLSTGKSNLNQQIRSLAEMKYTQYDGVSNTGWDVQFAVRNQPYNGDVMIAVCTKDQDTAGKRHVVVYDFNDNFESVLASDQEDVERGLPEVTAKDSAGNDVVYKLNKENLEANWYHDKKSNSSWSAPKPGQTGYLNLQALYQGYLQRNQNGDIVMVTFVQL